MHRIQLTAGLLAGWLIVWVNSVAADDPRPGQRDPATIFRFFDANGDKKLSKDEFLKLAERNARLKGNVDFVLRRLDADRDGFLTLQEYSQLGQMQGARPPMPPAAPVPPRRP